MRELREPIWYRQMEWSEFDEEGFNHKLSRWQKPGHEICGDLINPRPRLKSQLDVPPNPYWFAA